MLRDGSAFGSHGLDGCVLLWRFAAADRTTIIRIHWSTTRIFPGFPNPAFFLELFRSLLCRFHILNSFLFAVFLNLARLIDHLISGTGFNAGRDVFLVEDPANGTLDLGIVPFELSLFFRECRGDDLPDYLRTLPAYPFDRSPSRRHDDLDVLFVRPELPHIDRDLLNRLPDDSLQDPPFHGPVRYSHRSLVKGVPGIVGTEIVIGIVVCSKCAPSIKTQRLILMEA